MATHSGFLPGESQGQGILVGCCLWGRTELGTTEVTTSAGAAPIILPNHACTCKGQAFPPTSLS